MNRLFEYNDFVRSYLAGELNGLYFIHLDDGCRSSLAKLNYIRAKGTTDWNTVYVNPELEGHSISFIMEHFDDLPSIHLFKDGKSVKMLNSVCWPFQIDNIQEEYNASKENEDKS